ncbi:vertebrate ancient opsin-like [Esox lucius]|uniref:G-protein coupled receptors family 1 profile domain-containing protein n=1 Tax=Esox lucius TaxID=8010 RepID=A0A3P8YK43_ESOLU|nr:vertebrate ancient opsin-like [Esox lucius]
MILSNVSLSGCTRANSALCSGAGDVHLKSARGTTLSPNGNLIVALCLGLISTFGILNNLLVLMLFCRYKVLRSPINLLLINISFSDLLVCMVGTPFSFAASTQGRWLIGKSGCVWYGFVNTLLGIVSLISLAVLSYERYCTMMGPTEADSTNYRKIALGIAFSWVYSLGWTLPPLFGWSRYGPEGPGITCSVDWTAKNANNVSYIISLFVFCLIVPFAVIVYCYGKLLHAVRQVSGINTAMSRKREQRVLFMVVVMVLVYLICWLPYGVMALLATFGRPGLVTPVASIVPAVMAKVSTVVNPIIYIFMNKQFYRCFQALLKCREPQPGSSVRNSSKVPTKAVRGGMRRTADHNFTFVVASVGQPTSVAPQQGRTHVDPPADCDTVKPHAVLIVAHHNSEGLGSSGVTTLTDQLRGREKEGPPRWI